MNTSEAVRWLTEVIQRKHLALAMERSCCAWLRRYCDYVKWLPLHLSSEQQSERLLTVLAKQNIAASTQNQVFNAILFCHGRISFFGRILNFSPVRSEVFMDQTDERASGMRLIENVLENIFRD